MKNILKLFVAVLVSGVMTISGFSSVNALTLQDGAQAAQCDGCPSDLFGDAGVFRQVTNTILYIVGIVAVMMLIIGGIR